MQATETVREIPVDGRHLCGLTWAGSALWFSDADLDQILAVDPESGRVLRRHDCRDVRTDLTEIDGHLLQVAGPGRCLRLVDRATGRTVGEFPNPRPDDELCGLESGPEGLWLGYKRPGVLELRNPASFSLLRRLSVDQDVAGVTVIGPFVAYANHPNSLIEILSSETGRVHARLRVEGNPTGLTWDGRWIWYCDYSGRRLRALRAPESLELRSEEGLANPRACCRDVVSRRELGGD